MIGTSGFSGLLASLYGMGSVHYLLVESCVMDSRLSALS